MSHVHSRQSRVARLAYQMRRDGCGLPGHRGSLALSLSLTVCVCVCVCVCVRVTHTVTPISLRTLSQLHWGGRVAVCPWSVCVCVVCVCLYVCVRACVCGRRCVGE